MSTLEEIKSAIAKLSPDELAEFQRWWDDFLEDQLEMTPEFEAAIKVSEREMKAGIEPRVRLP